MANTTFFINADTPWCIEPGQTSPVMRALRDLRNDWYNVFGCPPLFCNGGDGCTLVNGTDFSNGRRIRIGGKCPIEEREAYAVYAENGDIFITGADELGLIYGIYTFSEQILGVDPWYYWNEFPPLRHREIEIASDLCLSHGSPTFKYRGFFVNNEEMIAGSFPDPLRENAMSLEKFERICELILRLKGNFIAPGTRIYADETSRDVADARGLYVNDHHVTPLGLNVYMWPKEVSYSYVDNRETWEKYWKTCIDAQKHRKMLWTVGFRGKGDGPFWHADKNAPTTDKERGELISRAVARQVELIREVQPNADIIFNMYSEQTDLCKKGYLTIPEGVIRVWCGSLGYLYDDGNAAAGDGAYYHITGCSNRYSESVPPERILRELGRYTDIGATGCLIVNTGNIRHFPVSIGCVMNTVYDASEYRKGSPDEEMKHYIRDYTGKYYGSCAEEVADIYLKLYGCSNFRKSRPGQAPLGYGTECLGLYASMWKQSQVQVMNDFRQSLYLQEMLRKYIDVLRGNSEFTEIWQRTLCDMESVLHEPEAYLPALSLRAHTLEKDIPERARALYRFNILAAIDMTNAFNLAHDHMSRSIKAYLADDRAEALLQIGHALTSLETGLEAFRDAQTQRWPAWFSWESLDCPWLTRDLLRAAKTLLEGGTVDGIRPFSDFSGHGRQVNAYHFERDNKHFPLLK